MAKKISDLTTVSSIQAGDYLEIARTVGGSSNQSVKRDFFDELGDNFAYTPDLLFNVSTKATVASSALTIYLTQGDGATNPSTNNARSRIAFRSATISDGAYTVLDVTATTSTVISAGSTAGLASGESAYIYVYALNNSGTVELAWSTRGGRDEGILWSTTAEGGAGAADSKYVLYSTTARANVPIRLIGRITISEVLAGSWTTAPSAIQTAPRDAIAPAWTPFPPGVYSFPSGNITVATGILAIGATTTAAAFGTGAILKAWYRDWGGSIDINYQIINSSTSGATAGNGIYFIPMPLGRLIDTTAITVSTTGYDGGAVGCLGFTETGAPRVGSVILKPQSASLMYGLIHYHNTAGGGSVGPWSTYTGASFSPNTYTFTIAGIITGVPVQ